MNNNTVPESEPEFTYGYHVVSFLDLLGQKERLCEIEGVLEGDLTEVKQKKLHQTLKRTVGTIWGFRKSFADYFESYFNRKPSIDVPEHIVDRFKQFSGNSKLNFQNFSDSIIAWTAVHPKSDFDYAHVLNTIHALLSSIALLTPYYLSIGVPFRGGIDLEGGMVLTPNGNDLYGPVLNRAYTLESKEARYPRVVIGKGLIDFLDQMSQVKLQDKALEEYCRKMAARCKSWIIVHDDQFPMIHFLGAAAKQLFLSINEGKDFHDDVINPMKLFILESERKAKEEKKEKLEEYYTRLRAYFEKYVGIWN